MSLSTHPTGQTIEARLAPLGLTIRPFRDPADYAPMAALMGLANMHDGIPWVPSRSRCAPRTRAPTASCRRTTSSSSSMDMSSWPSRWSSGSCATTSPTTTCGAMSGRTSAGAASATRCSSATSGGSPSGSAVEDPDAQVLVRAHAEESEIGHRTLLERRGFGPIRHFFLMHRATLDDVPDVALPDGLELRTVRPDDHRAIWDAEDEAFRDHWGAHAHTDHDFQVTFGQSDLDTDLWVVAWDGDEVAGVVQTWIWTEENERLGVKRGWLEKISVRRPWRKRGLGRAMTATALGKLRDAGMTDAMLGVDSENPTGALGLYEQLGFARYQRTIAYQREFDPSWTSPERRA